MTLISMPSSISHVLHQATASTDAPPNVPNILRLGKNQVDEGRAQGAVVAEAFRLLGQVHVLGLCTYVRFVIGGC